MKISLLAFVGHFFVPILFVATLPAFTGCDQSSKLSLEPTAFAKALREEGYRVEDETQLPVSTESNGSDYVKEAWRLRLVEAAGGEVFLYSHDLSTPEAVRAFRASRRGPASLVDVASYRYENENLRLYAAARPDPEVIAVFSGLRPPIDVGQAGWFLYPLGACLAFAVFVFVERWLALRRNKTVPSSIAIVLSTDRLGSIDTAGSSAATRIVAASNRPDVTADDLRAVARLEASGMERGLFLLEIVVGASPLLGLLGTVTGLTKVFSGFPTAGASPDASVFSEGIAMALLTTIIGLAIAIPALMGHAFLVRKVEKRAAELDLLVERLCSESQKKTKSLESLES
ncbi:MAG: MotA/TolQ/ExbB proton channel family protein [Opitutales bacterium]